MQHSPKGVSARYLRCRAWSLRGEEARAVGEVPVTCDVTAWLHQLRR